MAPDMEHVAFARENEEFADDIDIDYQDKQNWVITVRFYSLLHFIEERLQAHEYNSNTHGERKDNIRNCPKIDNKVRRLYRRLEDLSRDARYECIVMNDEDVKKSAETLEEGKEILGFGSGGGSTKYST